MSNVIKIKHGQQPPTNKDLNTYELGYSDSNEGLYIKVEDKFDINNPFKIVQLNKKPTYYYNIEKKHTLEINKFEEDLDNTLLPWKYIIPFNDLNVPFSNNEAEKYIPIVNFIYDSGFPQNTVKVELNSTGLIFNFSEQPEIAPHINYCLFIDKEGGK